ncbi:MAG: DUF2169 domain-containing protein [bacterium]|nr:DUF2169 domain-containing protein [bacterium]
MQVRRRNDVQLAWFPAQLTPGELSGIFLVKATFTITSDGRLQPAEEPEPASGDRATEAGDSLIYASDFVPFKPAADVTLHASAHAPGGQPVPHLPVEFQIGELRKRLAVIGDRQWQGGILGKTAGAPTPFATMPVAWDRALGSPKDPTNPVGVGRSAGPLPNIEWPDRLLRGPGDRIEPAGFGPIAAEWEPRVGRRGTYRGNYLETRWPWYPEDLEWSYFSAAPTDQRVTGYLRGDEELTFENLHREHSRLQTQLPGQQARCFVTFADHEFREVELALDTLHFDLEEDRCVLVWRGRTPVRSLRLREIQGVFGLLEPLGTEQPLAHYEALRDEAPAEEIETAEQDAAFAATFEQMDARVAGVEERGAQIEAEVEELSKQVEQEMSAQDGWLKEQGITPEMATPPNAPITGDTAFAAADEVLERLRAESPDLLPPEFAPVEAAPLEATPIELPESAAADNEEWTRERVERALASQTSMAEAELPGLDLQGLDFSGADLTKANLTGANLAGARFAGSVLDEADLTEAIVSDCTFQNARIDHATFDELELSGIDFSGTAGVGASFAGCQLTACNFERCNLPKTDFSNCDLTGANFRGADLTGARFGEATAARIDFTEATLEGLHAGDETDFTASTMRRAKLLRANLTGARLDGADLAYCDLRRALLTEATATDAELSRTNLANSVLDDANLAGAKLLQANLLYCSLERVDFTGADLRQANLYGSGTWQAITTDANLDGANLQATRLG